MVDDRYIRIDFVDKTSFRFEFKPEDADMEEVVKRVSKALEADKILLESEGDLYIAPVSNIKLIKVSPAPDFLPEGVIRNAHISKSV